MIQDSNLILMAEDDDYDAALFHRLFDQLEMPYRLISLQSGQSVQAYLEGTGPFTDRTMHPFPAMLVLDMKLPGCDGNAILALLRRRLDFPPLFVTKLTGEHHSNPGRTAMEVFGNTTLSLVAFLKPPSETMLRSLFDIFAVWRARSFPEVTTPTNSAE